MSEPSAAILQDIVATLARTKLFARVTLGPAPAEAAVPRCSVVPDKHEQFPADDAAGGRWGRLTAAVTIRLRGQSAAEGIVRGMELCDAAATALTDAPFRGGACRDLPIGPATAVGPAILNDAVKRPDVEISFPVTCHYETGGAP